MAPKYCIKCGKKTEQRVNDGPDWTEWRCVECGAQTDVYYFGPDYDDEYDEPIGSCDNCGTNLYEDDCYTHHGDELRGQCYWRATEATKL